MEFKPFIIMGEPRSGNILLQRLLATQSHVGVIPTNIDSLLEQAYKLGLGMNQKLEFAQRKALSDNVNYRLRRSSFLAQKKGLQPVSEISADSIETLHRLQLLWMSEFRTGSQTHMGLAMHGPQAYLPEMLNSTSMKCICILRDPRDVVQSRVTRGNMAIERHIQHWLHAAKNMRRLQQHPDLLVVRFEELLSEPHNIFRRIGEFLGTTIHIDLKNNSEIVWPNHSSFADLPKKLDPSVAFRWKKHPDLAIHKYVTWSCKSELKHWGYESTTGATLTAKEQIKYARRRALGQALFGLSEGKAWMERKFFPPIWD